MYQKLFTKILRDIVVMSKFLSYILVINCTLLGILAAKDSSGQSMSVNNIYLTLDMENVELQQVFFINRRTNRVHLHLFQIEY